MAANDAAPHHPTLAHPLKLFERRLESLLPHEGSAPAVLHAGMRHAVLSGGKRTRPRLLLAVARACGVSEPAADLAVRAACAVELVHSASLVHDDLPCFDDAPERRGRPTAHVLFGEAMALLVGDALLALAFEVLAEAPVRLAPRAMRLVQLLGQATGSSAGVIGGQSLELGAGAPSAASLERYHGMKTGALFRFAAEAGAVAAGAADHAGWAQVGLLIGAWYQLADDLVDVRGDACAAGKPVGRDALLGRPNAVCSLGGPLVESRMDQLLAAIRARVVALTIAPEPMLAIVESMRAQVANALAGAPAAEA